MKSLSKELKEKVFELYRQGLKLSEITELTGLGRGSLSNILYSSNVERRQFHNPKKPVVVESSLPDIPQDKLDRIIKLASFGYRPGEIAEDLNLKPGIVFQSINYLKQRNKIKSRV